MKKMKNYKVFLFGIGIVLLFSFYLFSREVKKERFRSIDFSITVKVQDRIRHRFGTKFDSVFEDIGFLASPIFSSVAILGITVIVFIKAKRFRKVSVLIIPLAFGFLILGELYGKSVVHHPAPPFFMIKNPSTIFPKYYINEAFSYPSGHAARAIFMSTILFSILATRYSSNTWRHNRWWVIAGLTVYVGLISVSRIYLGHHWFSDVFGGTLLGLAFGIIAMSAFVPYIKQMR